MIYLQVLQEAVWPGGTLPAQPRPERSAAEREETKEQCLDCLMQLLPGTQQLLDSDFSILICKALETILSFFDLFIICTLTELITDMLGSEKYRVSLETMLASLQDHQINK